MVASILRNAGTITLVGAALWILSAATSAIGQGSLFTPWSQINYELWSGVTALAVLCSYVALVAAAQLTGARREASTIAALAIGFVGVLLMVIGTWAWVATAIPMVIAFAWLLFRMRAAGVARPSMWLLVAAWPIGAATFILLDQLEVGPVDSYGDYSAAFVVGYLIAGLLFAAGTAALGLWLKSERSGSGTVARAQD